MEGWIETTRVDKPRYKLEIAFINVRFAATNIGFNPVKR